MPIIPLQGNEFWKNGKISERISGSSPGSTSISLDGESRATMVFIVEGSDKKPDPNVILNRFCQEALGWVEINSENGALKRWSPMTHPQFRWLYAERITSIKGIGFIREEKGDPKSKLSFADTFADNSWQSIPPYYLIYDKYEVTIEFSARNYLTLDDDTMSTLSIQNPDTFNITGIYASYYNDAGVLIPVTGNPYRESKRFISYTTETAAEFLTMKGGAFKFESDVPQINSQVLPGFYGKTLIPKVVVKLTWHMVPYAFVNPTSVASTNIFQALGRVNQDWFFGYGPGELLFTGFTNNQKMKNQFDVTNFFTKSDLTLAKLNDILYTDVVFNFLYIQLYSYAIDGTFYPLNPAGIINPLNRSYINAGHNLAQSQVNKQYYPIVSSDTASPVTPPNLRKRPIYDSYPFDLMFNAKPYLMAPESSDPIDQF